MTADEFEAAYAARSGLTVARLRELGRIVAPCHCGEDMCEGWQSTTRDRLLEDAAFRETRGAMSEKPIEMLPIVAEDGSVVYVEATPELVTPPAVRRKPTGGLFDPFDDLATRFDESAAALNATLAAWNVQICEEAAALNATLAAQAAALNATLAARNVQIWEEAAGVDNRAVGGPAESAETDRKRLDGPSVDK